jgi:glyoxylase-like metal-dependent hydrolase (beta-lactamase superfamily II)
VSVGADGVLLVDDQFAPLMDRILAALKALTDKPVRFVVNTHWHYDHTSANELHARSGAVIVAHENVRKRLAVEQPIEFFKKPYGPMPPAALPVVTFTDTVTFHLNGDDITAWHAPNAHTDGDTIVHFRKANVVHMGDIYFAGIYPFIDYGTGGSIKGVLAAIDRALALSDDNTKIIPGHGPLSTKKELLAYRNMIATIAQRIGELLQAGKTLPEIIAAQPTRDFDDVWGKGFLKPERFVEVIYLNLARRAR